MKPDQKAFRLGSLVLIGAVLLRLLSGALDTAAQALPQTEIARYLLFLQTGRLADTQAVEFTEVPSTVPTTEPAVPTQPQRPVSISFRVDDEALVQFRNSTDRKLDAGTLLTRPLDWDLTGEEPTVLIFHTHGTESYAGTENYRSTDENYNMLRVGDRLTAQLEAQGIHVLHDRTLHDQESYSGSYSYARQTLEQYLTQYPSIRLILDLHRDAAEDANGNQIDHTVHTSAGPAARLMLVMGTDAGGMAHPAWQDNLALAVKLQASLEKSCPGLCRPIYVRASRFNQDLSVGALLVEVGAAGNTLEEALLATDLLAQGILSLRYGANISA